jgi:hypothetical protein
MPDRAAPRPVKPPRPILPYDPNHACTRCEHVGTVSAYVHGRPGWRCPKCGHGEPIGGGNRG